MKKNSFLLLIVFSIFACGKKNHDDKGYKTESNEFKSEVRFSPPSVEADKQIVEGKTMEWSESGSGKSEPEESSGTNIKTEKINKKRIIKNGYISVKVKEIASAKKHIDGLIKKFGGYYDNEDMNNNEAVISYDLKIRIPSEKMEQLIASVEAGAGEIVNKRIGARDVTEELIDLESRLANKKNYLAKYTDLLKKAGSVKEVLAIEEQIRVLQEEIESKEGRLKYLNDQVSYSTLDINIFHNKEFVFQPGENDKFSEKLKQSLTNGWKGFVDFVLGGIRQWPFLLILTAVVLFLRRIIKRRRTKKNPTT